MKEERGKRKASKKSAAAAAPLPQPHERSPANATQWTLGDSGGV
jgi:hypothetical protein